MTEVRVACLGGGVVVGIDNTIQVKRDRIGHWRYKSGEREARLHTAVSSGAEYSMISVQRLDDLMVLGLR
jgi:hypothetical protein